MGVTLAFGNEIGEDMIEAVDKVPIPSGPGVREEVLVRFKLRSTRDSVIGAAAKLADHKDQDGRPTAGMRIEVPPRLQQPFRILFKYGQTLRSRHGQGTRRHVKFDDLTRSLYLNVKLPNDTEWSRVSLDLATRGIRAKQSINDGEIERRLDITGPPVDRPRPRSASVAAIQQEPMQMDPWTGRRSGSSSGS